MESTIESEGMHYEGNCIRPPPEAYSILLQVTLGCSHNRCTFCGSYRGKRFRIKDDEIILRDIRYAAKAGRRQVDSVLALWNMVFLPSSCHCRHASIRTLEERLLRSVHVGRSRFSRCCHLIFALWFCSCRVEPGPGD